MCSKLALVVDDSATMRHLIKAALARVPGLSVIEAPNGAEALELIEERPVDLILLDLNMPIMGGHAFLRRLKQLKGSKLPPVIVVTTEGNEQDVASAFQHGACAYVTKPVQAAHLADVVKDVLGMRDG
jgi:two-component system chemotaxis response regulator CheY